MKKTVSRVSDSKFSGYPDFRSLDKIRTQDLKIMRK